MIQFQHPDHASLPTNIPVELETDPVQIIARAMIEMSACGRTVDAEALVERTSLSSAEIESNWRKARDEANRRVRSTGRYHAAA